MDARVRSIILMMVQDTRSELASQFDIIKEYPGYRGLCAEASRKVMTKVTDYWAQDPGDNDLQIYEIHGEQRHSPISQSKYWIFQHTFVCVILNGEKLYIDPTSSQFQWLYPDIPDYYIGRKFPKWYYDDRKNPAWNGITNKINDKIQIPRWVNNKDGNRHKVYDGIIEFIQYEIWGRISDAIRFILKKRDVEYEG